MSKKRVLSPIEAERVNTIKTNARRLNMPMENIANDLGYTDSHIFGVFTGRYTAERTEVILSEMENYLVEKLGVRYVQPYFLDLKKEIAK